jgi:hypothetical protein
VLPYLDISAESHPSSSPLKEPSAGRSMPLSLRLAKMTSFTLKIRKHWFCK